MFQDTSLKPGGSVYKATYYLHYDKSAFTPNPFNKHIAENLVDLSKGLSKCSHC